MSDKHWFISRLSILALSLLAVMQWRVSSSLATITSLFLLFAGGLVVAQVDAPSCTDFESSWEWSFNSLDQNPCLVSAHLMATCYGGGNDILLVYAALCPHRQQLLLLAPSWVLEIHIRLLP
ncbi:hypothetical protein H4582DRAFT_230029 [Lactarius indigo]|nr:hypothetical protein H4582DRAFT_230029 [Lactarius indigo]